MVKGVEWAFEIPIRIGPGTIVVADNVGDVFDPHEYLAYVRTCGRYESEYREATIEYTDLPDGVEISLWG